jgi:2'-5' RNA ligase
MRAAIALLVDHQIHNFMRRLAVEFHQRYQVGFLGALLPPHISLKQPFQVTDLEAVAAYFDELAAGISPLEIRLTGLELQATTFQGKEYGILWMEVEESKTLCDLHMRINRELAERFENTGASFDGAEYTFHATVAIGGQPLEVYREFYNTLVSAEHSLSYVAREIAMFYYDDAGQPGTYITYRIQPIGGEQSGT